MSTLSFAEIIVANFQKKRRRKNKVDNHIYEAFESTCYECSAKDKVENDKENSVVEDAD